MKPILVTSGEPAGIGPDLCLQFVGLTHPVVILCDPDVLRARAKQLNIDFVLDEYNGIETRSSIINHLSVIPLQCSQPVVPGQLNIANAHYVVSMLDLAAQSCLRHDFSALVTAPVHKAVINQAGIPFTGHTEFFAQVSNVDLVVMMLACSKMKVALVTTHLPLSKVSSAITYEHLLKVIHIINDSLQKYFNIPHPKICIAGLNPHAGEGGYLGCEEIDVIIPAIDALKASGLNVTGPYSADTMFSTINDIDVFVAMYHDQGLPVLKYAGFGESVNVTLGLPFLRTSVDHGTALDLAGLGVADSGSLCAAVELAIRSVVLDASN